MDNEFQVTNGIEETEEEVYGGNAGSILSDYDWKTENDQRLRIRALELTLAAPGWLAALVATNGVIPVAAQFYNFMKGNNDTTRADRPTQTNPGS